MAEILKGLLGALKIPYLYFQAFRAWQQQRRNLTKWGANYGLPAPALTEKNADYRKRVYAAINAAGRGMHLPDNPLDPTPTGLHTECHGYIDQLGRTHRYRRINYYMNNQMIAHHIKLQYEELQMRITAWRAAGGEVEIVQDEYNFKPGKMTPEKFKEYMMRGFTIEHDKKPVGVTLPPLCSHCWAYAKTSKDCENPTCGNYRGLYIKNKG